MKKIIVVADWADDSLCHQEFRSATEGFLKKSTTCSIEFVSSTPSTIHTSYIIQQIVATEERLGKPRQTILFENTDPRIQTKNAIDKAEGANFVIIKLHSGMLLCGPNAGYNFSLIKNKIAKIYLHEDLNKGSQFRSRELYSKVSAQLVENRMSELELIEANVDIIPNITDMFIGHIDNYGNIKTTIKLNDLKTKYSFGDSIRIEINGVKKSAKFVDNLFGGSLGKLVIYPGSSGDIDNPYVEISIWRHFTEKDISTGKDVFNNPRPGNMIVIN